jgi:D-alanine-D-alanine ligase
VAAGSGAVGMQVALLAGGPSAEHEVSLQTGAEMLAQLQAGGFAVRPVLVTRDNTWHFGARGGDLAAAASAPGVSLEAALAELRRSGEVACLALHGTFGEDGRLQRLFEQHGVRFTGSGSHASAIGMDKDQSKLAATRLGAPCARHEVVALTAAQRAAGKAPVNRLLKLIGLPCVVKPVCGGSSVGVSRVRAEEQLAPAVHAACAADPEGRAMVEEWQEGTEVTCGVLRRDGAVLTLPLVAIRPAGDAFYDYHAKYEAEDTQLVCPAPVSAAAQALIERIARGLYEGLELRGAARVDFILRRADDVPVFLELNTLPGFTSHSLVPLAAGVAGMSRLDVLRAVLADSEAPSPATRRALRGGAT